MTIQGLPATILAALGLGAFAIVVLMYTVRWRVPQRIVATTALWLDVTARRRGGGRLGALDHVVSLLLHLVIAGALVTALGLPRLACQSPPGRALMMVFDRSPSMATLERIEPRLETARRRALARLEESASADAIGLVFAGGPPEIVQPLGRDPTPLRRAIANTPVRTGAGRLEEAVGLACALLAGHTERSLVVVTDGSEPIGECPGASLEVVAVGTARPNLGVVALAPAASPRDPLSAEAFVEVLNAAPISCKAELRLDLDGSLLRVAELTLQPGERVHRLFEGIPLGGTGRLVARLTKIHFEDGTPDALPEDDSAYAVLARRTALPIDLVGDNAPLKMVLTANPRYAVTRRGSLAEARGAGAAVTVIAGRVPSELPPGRYLLVNPSGPGAPGTLKEVARDPSITYWRDEHPILRRVVVSDLRIAQATPTKLPASAVSLVGGKDVSLVYALTDGSRRVVGMPFELESSNLPLRVGFPVLIYNAIDWLAQAPEEAATDSWTVRSTSPVELTSPDARPRTLDPEGGKVVIAPGTPGFYEVSSGGRLLGLFASSVAAAEETAVSPRAPQSAGPAASNRAGRLTDREIAPWLLMLALALTLIEWVTFHRRKTV